MHFDLSTEQRAIKSTARELLADRFSLERAHELVERREYDEQTMRELCELGWPGIFVEPDYGGQGLGTFELVILMEEIGSSPGSLAFLSQVGAGLALQHCGSPEQRASWLPAIAAGRRPATIGIAEDGSSGLVPDAVGAEAVILVDGRSATIFGASDLICQPVEALDVTRRFARVAVGRPGEPLPRDAAAAVDRVLVVCAAELVGTAQRAMELAVEYAGQREQFGQKIGSFQAVSHRCAQMLLEVENARSLVYHAGWVADAEPENLPLAASMAFAYAADCGRRVTTSALQVLGGIGFTWEHELHIHLRRAATTGTLFSTAYAARSRVAALTGFTAPAVLAEDLTQLSRQGGGTPAPAR